MMSRDIKKEFEEIIKPYENTLLDLERRLYFIEAVEAEFAKKMVGDKLEIKGDAFWMMYQDMYKMLIIELKSFVTSIYVDGGFLGQMNNFLSGLKVPGRDKISTPQGSYQFLNYQPSEDEIKQMQRDHNVAYRKQYQQDIRVILETMFPRLKNVPDVNSAEFKVTQQDIQDFKDRLKLDEHEIGNSRHTLAHRHDNGPYSAKGNVISPEEIRKLTKQLEQLFNDFRAVIGQSTLAYTDMNGSSENSAEDFIELVSIGSINQIYNAFGVDKAIGDYKTAMEKNVFLHQFRDAYWAKNKIPMPPVK